VQADEVRIVFLVEPPILDPTGIDSCFERVERCFPIALDRGYLRVEDAVPPPAQSRNPRNEGFHIGNVFCRPVCIAQFDQQSRVVGCGLCITPRCKSATEEKDLLIESTAVDQRRDILFVVFQDSFGAARVRQPGNADKFNRR